MTDTTPHQITAFLYAGALQRPEQSKDYEHWEGHTGFVQHCADYAEAINAYLNTRAHNDEWPGVIYYELIESMGEWLIGLPEPLSVADALAFFTTEYENWITQ